MKKKTKFSIPSKYWLFALSIVCIGFIALSYFTDKLTKPIQTAVSYVVTPLQSGVNGMGLWLTDKADTWKSMKTLTAENEALQEKIDELNEMVTSLQQNAIDYQNLKELYKLDKEYPQYTKVGATVIGKDSGNWFSTFKVDKGSDDGIEIDMNVTADGGLVGIVIEVGKNYSIVRSIIDDQSNVSAMLLTTGDTCNVKGDLKLMESGYIQMAHMKKDVEVNEGDKLVTSNISSKYLPGILIGYITSVTKNSNNLTQSGCVVPVVDFEHIRNVLIIMEKKE